MGRQEWSRSVERDRSVLERILALLFALAALTDRAAGLPAAKRLHLLAALGHGEAEARAFIFAMASHPCPDAPVDPTAAPSPAAGDAALLAARFRLLALALTALLARARDRAPRRHVSPLALSPGCKPRRLEGWRAVTELPAPDT